MLRDFQLNSYYNFELVVVPAEGVDKGTFFSLVKSFSDFYQGDEFDTYFAMPEYGVVESGNETHTCLRDDWFQKELFYGDDIPDVPGTVTGQPMRISTGGVLGEHVPNRTFYFSGVHDVDPNPIGARDALKTKMSELGIRVVETGDVVEMPDSRPSSVQHISALAIAPQ